MHEKLGPRTGFRYKNCLCNGVPFYRIENKLQAALLSFCWQNKLAQIKTAFNYRYRFTAIKQLLLYCCSIYLYMYAILYVVYIIQYPQYLCFYLIFRNFFDCFCVVNSFSIGLIIFSIEELI